MQAFLPRVSMHVDPDFDPAAPRLTQVALTVRLAGGRTRREVRSGARGHPDRPLSAMELATKFRSCARRVLSEPAIARVLDALGRVDTLRDAAALTSLLVGPA